MADRPILFSAPMVQAILAGRKGQTRRIVKPQPIDGDTIVRKGMGPGWMVGQLRDSENAWRDLSCPYGLPGDRLWVRENWIYRGSEAHFGGGREPWAAAWIKYPADGTERTIPRPVHDNSGVPSQRRQRNGESDWDYSEYIRQWFHACRPSIHMPRWACRINLEVTGVRIERLQDISEADAKAEGVKLPYSGNFTNEAGIQFRKLWESINGPESWDANPWVWVVEFKRIEVV